MSEFSKVKLFNWVGLLSKRYNFQTNQFENHWGFRLNMLMALLLKLWFAMKFYLSSKFPQTNIIQLYIGSCPVLYQDPFIDEKT